MVGEDAGSGLAPHASHSRSRYLISLSGYFVQLRSFEHHHYIN